jgi:hypothetical protein
MRHPLPATACDPGLVTLNIAVQLATAAMFVYEGFEGGEQLGIDDYCSENIRGRVTTGVKPRVRVSRGNPGVRASEGLAG